MVPACVCSQRSSGWEVAAAHSPRPGPAPRCRPASPGSPLKVHRCPMRPTCPVSTFLALGPRLGEKAHVLKPDVRKLQLRPWIPPRSLLWGARPGS